MRRFLFNFLFIITLFVFQGTIFQSLSVGRITPNLLLILTVSTGLMRGRKSGIIIGFASGILLDIFCGTNIGFYAMVYMYLGYFAGCFNKIFYPEDIKLPVVYIALSDLFFGFVCYVFLFLLKGKTDIGYYFLHICLPECAYTAIVTIILYPIIFLINRSIERKERKQARKFV